MCTPDTITIPLKDPKRGNMELLSSKTKKIFKKWIILSQAAIMRWKINRVVPKLALFKKQMHRKKSFPYPFFFLFRLAAKFHLSPYKGGFTHIIIFFSVGGATIKCVVAKLPEYFKTCPVSPWDLISNISSWMLAQISDPVTFHKMNPQINSYFKGPGKLTESSWIYRQNCCRLTAVSVF